MMQDEEEQESPQLQELSYIEKSLLTLEKLTEFKSMFEYYKSNNKASIKDMKQDILENFKGFVINLPEFDTFFKNYENDDVISEQQFYDIFNFYEQKIFEKASVFEDTEGTHTKEVEFEESKLDQAEEDEANKYLEEMVVDEESEEDTEDKDPEVALQDIIDHVIDMNSLDTMTPQQVAKLIVKLKNKVDQVNVKVQKLEKKSNKNKNAAETYKNERDYFKNKSKDLKKENEKLHENNYKLEGDVEDLMKFEKDFQKILKESEEKDMEIIKLEDELEERSRELYNLEREHQE